MHINRFHKIIFFVHTNCDKMLLNQFTWENQSIEIENDGECGRNQQSSNLNVVCNSNKTKLFIKTQKKHLFIKLKFSAFVLKINSKKKKKIKCNVCLPMIISHLRAAEYISSDRQ